MVALYNSFGINGDPTDIVAQIIIQEAFGLKPRIDLVGVAETLVLDAKARWTTLISDWEGNRRIGTKFQSSQSYVGSCTNNSLSMTLHISFACDNLREGENETMILSFDGIKVKTFRLFHYRYNSRSFLPKSRDECMSQEYTAYVSNWKCFAVKFGGLEGKRFAELTWVLDEDTRVAPQCLNDGNRLAVTEKGGLR